MKPLWKESVTLSTLLESLLHSAGQKQQERGYEKAEQERCTCSKRHVNVHPWPPALFLQVPLDYMVPVPKSRRRSPRQARGFWQMW